MEDRKITNNLKYRSFDSPQIHNSTDNEIILTGEYVFQLLSGILLKINNLNPQDIDFISAFPTPSPHSHTPFHPVCY